MTPESTHNTLMPELLARFFDGELSDADHASLADALRDNPHAQQLYLDYCWTHALLRHELGDRLAGFSGQLPEASGRKVESRESRVESGSGMIVESGEWRVESEEAEVESRESRVKSEAEFPEIPKSLNSQIPTLHSPLSTLHSAWAFSYAVATLLLSIALLGAWFSTITHPDADSFVKNSRRVTPSGDTAKDTPQFVFVGKVSGMVDCQFADSSTSTVPGAYVTLNRRYALKSGLMEIAYDSGAKVILQGPCDYMVESRSSGFLQVGKLVAKVELSLIHI